MVQFEGETIPGFENVSSDAPHGGIKTPSRRTVLFGIGGAAALAAAYPVFKAADRFSGQKTDHKTAKTASKAPTTEGELLDRVNLFPNGSLEAYEKSEANNLIPKLWRLTNGAYEHAKLNIGAGPEHKNAIWAETFTKNGELIVPAWTTKEPIIIDPKRAYGLIFQYRVRGKDTTQVSPLISLREMENETVTSRRILLIPSDQFDASTGEWQTASFMFEGFGSTTKFIWPVFSLANHAENPQQAEISYAGIHFGEILKPGDPRYKNSSNRSQRA